MTNKEAKKWLRQMYKYILDDIPHNDEEYIERPQGLIDHIEQKAFGILKHKIEGGQGPHNIDQVIRSLSLIQLNTFLLHNKEQGKKN